MVTDHNLYITEKIFESNGGMLGNISIYGLEGSSTTHRLTLPQSASSPPFCEQPHA